LTTELRYFARRTTISLLSALFSIGVHSCVVVPYVLSHWPDPAAIGEDVEDGPLGDGPIGTGQAAAAAPELLVPLDPVNISIYAPPPPEVVPTEVPEETAPEVPVAPETPVPTQPVVASSGGSSGGSGGSGGSGTNTSGDGSGEATDSPGDPDNSGVVGQPTIGGQRDPCEEISEVTQLNSTKWRVQRKIVDYYASHLRQLDRQAGTATAHGREGVPIGVRVYLPRCSVLRSVGLRNKDIILSINDRPVATLPQAIKTWLALRNERDIVVQVRRRGVGKITHNYRIVR
jgi:hypothetical protein